MPNKFFLRNLALEKAIEQTIKTHKSNEDDIKVPDDLAKQVRKVLSSRKELRWDRAVYKIAGGKIEPPPEPKKPKPKAKPKPEPKKRGVNALNSAISEGERAIEDLQAKIESVLGKGFKTISGQQDDNDDDEDL